MQIVVVSVSGIRVRAVSVCGVRVDAVHVDVLALALIEVGVQLNLSGANADLAFRRNLDSLVGQTNN